MGEGRGWGVVRILRARQVRVAHHGGHSDERSRRVPVPGREGRGRDQPGGEKFQPREVEEILLADGRVRAAVVVGRPHPLLGEEPVAFVLAQGVGRKIEPGRLSAELAERCARSLSRYKRPVEIHIAQSLPAGPTGKIRRAEVRRIAAAGPPATTTAASLP